MNKDEADKLISQALIALKANDYDKAMHLLQRAQRLHQSEAAAKLIKRVKKLKKNIEPVAIQYSLIEEEACKNILLKKNYYEILSVSSTCSQEDIKKSYRKLVLKYHPDKNNCPSASDAFKIICKAYKKGVRVLGC